MKKIIIGALSVIIGHGHVHAMEWNDPNRSFTSQGVTDLLQTMRNQGLSHAIPRHVDISDQTLGQRNSGCTAYLSREQQADKYAELRNSNFMETKAGKGIQSNGSITIERWAETTPTIVRVSRGNGTTEFGVSNLTIERTNYQTEEKLYKKMISQGMDDLNGEGDSHYIFVTADSHTVFAGSTKDKPKEGVYLPDRIPKAASVPPLPNCMENQRQEGISLFARSGLTPAFMQQQADIPPLPSSFMPTFPQVVSSFIAGGDHMPALQADIPPLSGGGPIPAFMQQQADVPPI